MTDAINPNPSPPDERARDDVKRTHISLPVEPPDCEHGEKHGRCPDCFTAMENRWIVEVGRAADLRVQRDVRQQYGDRMKDERDSLRADLSLARDQRDEALNDKAQVEKERDSFKAEVERRVTANARANIASADIARERDSLRKMVAELEVKLVEARKERPNWQTTADTIDAQARADVWEKAFRILASETKAGGQ